MAYDGWLSYAGVEIANVPRLQAYVKGMAPGLLRNCDCDCDLLPEVLEEKPYTNPVTDRAPWVDAADEDTWGFLGVMPLSITGLQDSSREVPITQNVRDGGFIGPSRKRSKEFRLRALMVARDEAALEAGYSWFNHVTSNAGCGGGCLGEGERFCYLSSCPTELTDVAGMETVDVDFEGLEQNWRETLKAHWPGQVWEQVEEPPAGTPDDRAGDLWISNSGVYVWDSEENEWALWNPADWLAQFGAVALWRSQKVNNPLPCGPVTWNITATAPTRRNATVTVRDMRGILSVTEQEVGPDPTVLTISEGEQAETNTWVEISGAAVEVHSIAQTAATGPVWRKCADEYLRSLRNVTVVDGPNIIRDYEVARGVMREVEVVFEATTPHTFHVPINVLSVDRASVDAIPGVRVRTIEQEVPMCEEEVVPNWRDALADPACPFDPPPPLPRAEPSSCMPPTRYGYSYEVYIPPGIVPEWGEMVPTLSVKAGPSIVRGIRARFHANPLGAPIEELDPCGECASYVISFIPQGATFTADGITEKAFIDVVGNTFTGLQYLDAALPGQDFTWPTLTCGVGYTILVEVSANNEIEGIELSLTERE